MAAQCRHRFGSRSGARALKFASLSEGTCVGTRALCRAFTSTQRPKFRTLCVDGANWAWVREGATLLTSLARAVTNLRRLRLEGEPADVTHDSPLDELAQLLALHCPCLVSVSVDSKHPLMGSVGVSALASAPSVTSVAFWRARCERGMLVDVFERLCQRDSRTLEISFLQSWVDYSEMFPTFLAYLEQAPPDRFANLRLSLRVAINGYETTRMVVRAPAQSCLRHSPKTRCDHPTPRSEFDWQQRCSRLARFNRWIAVAHQLRQLRSSR
jgi:hypothetical protein